MPVTDMRRNGFWITLVYRTDRESYAEGIYLPGLRLDAHGVAPQGRGVPPVREPRYGAD